MLKVMASSGTLQSIVTRSQVDLTEPVENMPGNRFDLFRSFHPAIFQSLIEIRRLKIPTQLSAPSEPPESFEDCSASHFPTMT